MQFPAAALSLDSDEDDPFNNPFADTGPLDAFAKPAPSLGTPGPLLELASASSETLHEPPSQVDRVQGSIDASPFKEVDLSAQRPPGPAVEARLAQREAEVLAREKALRAREVSLDSLKPPNFPPWWPVFYHSIAEEIPPANQQLVTLLFRTLLFVVAQTTWNALTFIVLLFIGPGAVGNPITNLLVSLVDVVICPPLALFLWYRPLYSAYKRESSLLYYVFFIFFSIHILWQAYKAVGLTNSGSAGILTLLTSLASVSLICSIFVAISLAMWALGAVSSVWLLRRVHSHYRTEGHSLASARQDLARESSNRGVMGRVMGFLGSSSATNPARPTGDSYLRSTAHGDFA